MLVARSVWRFDLEASAESNAHALPFFTQHFHLTAYRLSISHSGFFVASFCRIERTNNCENDELHVANTHLKTYGNGTSARQMKANRDVAH